MNGSALLCVGVVELLDTGKLVNNLHVARHLSVNLFKILLALGYGIGLLGSLGASHSQIEVGQRQTENVVA